MAKQNRDRKRQKAFRRGILSEYLACLFLLSKGYRIAALRYKTGIGEIDIIARKGDLAIFIEVKARRSVDDAVFAVNTTAARRIRDASDIWLGKQANPNRISQRYDIIAIVPWRLPVHFVDAF